MLNFKKAKSRILIQLAEYADGARLRESHSVDFPAAHGQSMTEGVPIRAALRRGSSAACRRE